jgi:hypothetical protein
MALTDAQIKDLMAANAQFRNLVHIYGKPRPVGNCSEPGAKPGDICMEGNCVNGKKLVMMCNKTNGCTLHAEVPC